MLCDMQVPEDGDGTPAKAAPRAAFKFNSVGSQFKKQLGELMSQLLTMEPHYVRCVKPNGLNRPGLFENTNALHQLRCGGKCSVLICILVHLYTSCLRLLSFNMLAYSANVQKPACLG